MTPTSSPDHQPTIPRHTQKTPCPSRRGIPKALREWRKFIYDVQPAEEKHSLYRPSCIPWIRAGRTCGHRPGFLLLCTHSHEEGKYVSFQSILWLQLVAEGQQGFQLFHNAVLLSLRRKRDKNSINLRNCQTWLSCSCSILI